jgi:hypothetical protein
MKLFLLFGIANFLYLTVIVLAILAVLNKRAGRLWSYGLKGWLIRSAIVSFGYAAFIFLIEKEGPGFEDPNDSIFEIYKNGLPIYLSIFSFLAIIPSTIGFLLWAEKQPKNIAKNPSKRK